ncbi:hypothetical protein AAMO2058_001705600 [Amorphochlora amoebiformis]
MTSRSLSPEENELRRMIQACRKPTDLLKFGHHGKPKWRKFHLGYTRESGWFIEWSSKDKSKETKLALKNIKKLTFGQQTAKFERLSRQDVASKSFSLWYQLGEKKDTLDLVAENEILFNTWTQAIISLVRNKVSQNVLQIVQPMGEDHQRSLDALAISSIKLGHLKVKKKYEAALETINVVYGFGLNTWGQLSGSDSEVRLPLLMTLNTGESVTEIASGWSHTTLLMSDGSLEQLGHKLATAFDKDQRTPSSVKVSQTIDGVACGRLHNAFLTEDGNVYTWGCNFYGQLGHGDNTNRSMPTYTAGLTNAEITEICCGLDYTVALSQNAIFTWGCGRKGVLGHGDEKNRTVPTLVKGIDTPNGVACGAHHMLAWSKNASKMYSWGANASGQLGLGHCRDMSTPQEIPKLSGSLTVITAACGGAHSIAVTMEKKGLKTSKVWSFGSNSTGQCAQGSVGEAAKILEPVIVDSLERIQEVVCGSMHTLARSEDGMVWASGCNRFGQLGIEGGTKYLNRFTVVTSLKDKNPRALAASGMHSFVLCPKKWLRDDEVDNCMRCKTLFTFINRRHHCRNCCGIFCNKCSSKKIAILSLRLTAPQRVCDQCYLQLRNKERK